MLPPLVHLAREKNAEFIYYCKQIPEYLREYPVGNYKFAKKYCTFVEIGYEQWNKKIDDLKNASFKKEEILINQGGLQKESALGIKMLAKEIDEWAEEKEVEDLKIFLPSGTGTTALFLQKFSKFQVFTTPCVGDSDYLKKQFFEIEKDETLHSQILDLEKKYHFGKPYKEFYQIYQDLKQQTGIEFELLYDPKGWMVLEKYKQEMGENILYIHQGGVFGNESMIQRYSFSMGL